MRAGVIVLMAALIGSPAHADESSRRLKITGAVLTAIGIAATAVGVGVLAKGEQCRYVPGEFGRSEWRNKHHACYGLL